MTYVLTARERKLLDHMQFDHKVFQIPGQLPVGSGKVTLARLVELGLLETGPGRFNEMGYRITDDGWRCIYGKTHDAIIASGTQHVPLRIWSWPPTPDTLRKAQSAKPRLATLPPRIPTLPPRLKTLD